MKLKKIKKTANLTANLFKYGFNSFYSPYGDNFEENSKISALKAVRNMFEGDDQIIQTFEESLFGGKYRDSYSPECYITEDEIFNKYGLRREAWQYDVFYSQYDPYDETNEATIVMHGNPDAIPVKVREEDFLLREINELSKAIIKLKKKSMKLKLKNFKKIPDLVSNKYLQKDKEDLKLMEDLLPRLTRAYILIQAGYGCWGFSNIMKLFSKLKMKGLSTRYM